MSYRVIKELGRGSMGKVELIEHEVYGKSVLKTNLKKDGHRVAVNEGQALKYLSETDKCPWNIKVYNYEEDPDGSTVRVFMEYFEGIDLTMIRLDFMADGFDRWMLLVRETVAAVTCLHDMGVAHRDIKLANIMFDDTNLKLVDFGFACVKKTFRSLCKIGMMGSPYYLSPELWLGENTKGTAEARFKQYMASDVWALAHTLFRLAYKRNLVGRRKNKADIKKWVTLGTKVPLYFYPNDKELDRLKITSAQSHEINVILKPLFARDTDTRIANFKALVRSLGIGSRVAVAEAPSRGEV